MAVTAEEFKGALRRFGSGVTVIAARTDGVDHGMTASAFCSLSLNPPRVLVCVAKTAAMHAALVAAGHFAVSILSEDLRNWSDRFARRAAPGEDRFADIAEIRAPESGARWLPGSLATLDCAVAETYDGGDHTIFVGDVLAAATDMDAEPHRALLYVAGRYRRVGDAL